MKKLILVLTILILTIAGHVLASTVTAIDGQNFLVTNDYGVSANYSGALINSYVISTQQTMQRDQQTLVADSETYAIWLGVQQSATNAENSFQANQVNSNI